MDRRGKSSFVIATAAIWVLLSSQPVRDARAATWQLVPTTGGPSPRRDAALGYDRKRHRVILFGGLESSGELADTWELNLHTWSWRQLAVGATSRPAPRFSMVSGIESAADRFVISVGQGSGGFFNDTWSFDLVSETWTQIATTGAVPSTRYGSSGGVFDPGGFTPATGGLFVTHGFTDAGRFDDTWEVDVSSGVWTDRTPVAPLPLRRCLHGGAMRSDDGLIVFGGCASGFGPCPLDDTWRFDASAGGWTDLTKIVRPPARVFPSLVRMGDGRDFLLFGGQGAGMFNDLWRLESEGGDWSALAATGTPPSPRFSGSMVWIDGPDRTRTGGGCGFALLFGGQDPTGPRNDVWVLSPATQPASPDIRAGKTPEGVLLSWANDPSALQYEVWRSTDPRFPSTPSATSLLPGSVVVGGATASHVDANPAPPAPIHFYKVRLARCGGF